MRTVLVVSVLAACSSRSSEPPVETGAFRFEDVVETTDEVTHVRVRRHEVPLDKLPLAEVLAGLPMSGNANVDIDLRVPIIDGESDARRATGTFALACPKGCSIGDGVARLRPMHGEGLPFGRLTFDELDIRGEVKDGKVELTRWHAVSKDVALDVALKIQLASAFDDSQLDGCVKLKANPTLAQRDPQTAAVIATTGGLADDAGVFHIKIAGSAGQRKLLARLCTDQVAAGD